MKSVLLAIFLLLTLILLSVRYEGGRSDFETWKEEYGQTFESRYEDAYRQIIFNKNVESIRKHNQQEDRSFDKGVNKFTALTDEQFGATYLKAVRQFTEVQAWDNEEEVVGDVDWRSEGAVTGVKDQGSCQAGYAFSAVGVLEALSYISFGRLQTFSEQQVVDCTRPYNNNGCGGGSMVNTFKFVRDHGITYNQTYPYEHAQTYCKISYGQFRISGYNKTSGCSNLANALKHRPISAAVDSSYNWRDYAGGIINSCGSRLDHGILVVGFNDIYWIVKNSWGSSWGENGYAKVGRGNTCGICNDVSYGYK